MLSEKAVRAIMRNKLHMFELFPDDTHCSEVMMLAEILEISNEDLNEIVRKGYKAFHVIKETT